MESIGEHRLGDLARAQIEAARRDPRLDRAKGATVVDFWDACEEAERVRLLGILGLQELTRTLARHERELGVRRDDPNLAPNVKATLQAAWERAESARAEIANGHPYLSAQALISLNSALDALVEDFAPAMRAIRIQAMREQAVRTVEGAQPEAFAAAKAQLGADRFETAIHVLKQAMGQTIGDMFPKEERLYGSGADRYERVLRAARLDAPGDRPIPQDLDMALTELGALRDVLIHRGGRVDARALKQAPSLRYADGDFVRISPDDYRTYSAAINCYAAEINYRVVRSWPGVTDATHGPRLDHWRDYRRIGA